MFEVVAEADADQALADLARQDIGLAEPYPRVGRAYGRFQGPAL